MTISDLSEETILNYPIRLNRFLASCAMGSRRKVEQFILEGRVSINGKIIDNLSFVLTEPCHVAFDGKRVYPSNKIYLAMNKPRGILSAAFDKRERTVVDLLPDHLKRLRPFPVGRLDKESEGLILLTNDGECAQKVIHPSSGIIKTYDVRLNAPLSTEKVVKWRSGVNIEGRLFVPQSVVALDGNLGKSFRVGLKEGIKREIRLMAQNLGSRVVSLRRVSIGRMQLTFLKTGEYLLLSHDELWQGIESGINL